MAHYIDESLGKAAFGYDEAEGAAWHALGNPIDKKIAKDPQKIAEFVGANYKVAKFPISYDFNGTMIQVPNREALVRKDTGAVLEVLSENRYHEVQPVEYFEAFRDSLAANNLRISAAGVLKGGRIVFVNAILDDDFKTNVMGVDQIIRYICMGGGYDGKMSSFGYLSDFRTVCWNTLSANLSKSESANTQFRMPHSAPFDGKALGKALGMAGKELKVRADVFNALAQRGLVNDDEAKAYIAEVLNIDISDGSKALSSQQENKLAAVINCYKEGPGANLQSAKGTMWGALNAITHFVDHLATTRDTTKDGNGKSRFASAHFGSGGVLKARALQLAMRKAEISEKVLLAA